MALGDMPFVEASLVVLGAYGLGSIPFGLVVAKLFGLGDLRRIGSGNIGATNVLRTGSKAAALATLLLDGGKGVVAVLAATGLAGSPGDTAVAAVAVVLGHCFPVWLGFRGGKGVATGIGAVFAMQPLAGLAMGAAWLATAALGRISSLAALVSYGCCPVALYLLSDAESGAVFAAAGLAVAAVSWWRHRDNIARILGGTEPRIGA